MYNGVCTNCHEEIYIYEQDQRNDVHVDFSEEFMKKVKTQENLKNNAERQNNAL